MIRLSIALVTRNRPESLDRCLASIRAQNVQPFEVVISDDSNLDRAHETKDVANRWDCRYVAGPRRGLYANRNHVALACEGTHIRTVDDDHLFPANHLELCLEAVRSDPQSIWTTGELTFTGDKYDTAPFAGQLTVDGLAGAVKDINDNWAIADGSTIYPREVFAQGHRMVEWFGYGSSYLEFGAYLYRHDFKSRCIPNALVEHHPTEDSSLLTRSNTKKVIESRIYACICYNVYFRPNWPMIARYVTPCLIRTGLAPDCLESAMLSWERAKQRWLLTDESTLVISS